MSVKKSSRNVCSDFNLENFLSNQLCNYNIKPQVANRNRLYTATMFPLPKSIMERSMLERETLVSHLSKRRRQYRNNQQHSTTANNHRELVLDSFPLRSDPTSQL